MPEQGRKWVDGAAITKKNERQKTTNQESRRIFCCSMTVKVKGGCWRRMIQIVTRLISLIAIEEIKDYIYPL